MFLNNADWWHNCYIYVCSLCLCSQVACKACGPEYQRIHTSYGSPKPFINLKNVVQKPKRNQKKTPSKEPKGFLTSGIIFTNIGHMIFIMLKKKSLTTHLHLTNPAAVFLNNNWLYYSHSTVSSLSVWSHVACKASGPKINVFTSYSPPFTWFRMIWQTCTFLWRFTRLK